MLDSYKIVLILPLTLLVWFLSSHAAMQHEKSTLQPIVVVIDPGHGGHDHGVRGQYGTAEKTIVLAIAKRLGKNLNKIQGYQAYLTRYDDRRVTYKQRVQLVNKRHADFFLSLHANEFQERSRGKIKLYKFMVASRNFRSLIERSDIALAKLMQQNFAKVLPVATDNIAYSPLVLAKLPSIPALLVGFSFRSHASIEMKLRNRVYQQHIVAALSHSITHYFSHAEPLLLTHLASLKQAPEKLLLAKQQRRVKAKFLKTHLVQKRRRTKALAVNERINAIQRHILVGKTPTVILAVDNNDVIPKSLLVSNIKLVADSNMLSKYHLLKYYFLLGFILLLFVVVLGWSLYKRRRPDRNDEKK